MIAIEVSSAAGPPPHGGVGGAIRNTVQALVRLDPGTRYLLCYRLSRWRRGELFRVEAPNAAVRVVQDPLNRLLVVGARLFHSMGIFLPRTPRIPKLLTVHDLNAVRNVHWVRPEWHERRSRRILEAVSRADHVITYSAFTAGEVREEYRLPEERVHPVLLGVDAEAFRPAAGDVVARTRAAHGDYVMSVGLLTSRKNFVRLIEAVAGLKDLRLVLVGRGTDGERAVEAALDRFAMRERVTRLVRTPHEQLRALISSARAFVVPSLYEGFGLTVLEAMACGAPLVCSRAASLPEVGGDAPLYVDATDVEELREGIRRAVEDEALAAGLRARGLARAREMSWDATARRLRAIYRDVAGV